MYHEIPYGGDRAAGTCLRPLGEVQRDDLPTSAATRSDRGLAGRPVLRNAGELRRLAAEALGTASLLAAIVGSGLVVAEGGDLPAQLFQHALVVGGVLTVLILTYGPVSGAHFNPCVTLVDAWFGGMRWGRAARYIAAQLIGAVAGTVFANVSLGHGAVAIATTGRPGLSMVMAEGAATAGLLIVIFGLVRSGGSRVVVAAAVGLYIAAAIVFTASNAFANPAVTLARLFTDSWTGIDPASVPAFLAGQAIGTVVAVALVGWLFQPDPAEASAVVVPVAGPPPEGAAQDGASGA